MPRDPAPYDWRSDLIDLFPERAACAVAGMPQALADRMIELRIGSNRPMLALDCRRDYYIAPDGQAAAFPNSALALTPDECRQFMDYVTKYSAYAYADELRNGFLTVRGGYRVGVAGKAVVDGSGSIAGFGVCTSFCIRIPHEVRGAAGDLCSRIRRGGSF